MRWYHGVKGGSVWTLPAAGAAGLGDMVRRRVQKLAMGAPDRLEGWHEQGALQAGRRRLDVHVLCSC